MPFDLDRLSNNTSESVSESDKDVPRVTDFVLEEIRYKYM